MLYRSGLTCYPSYLLKHIFHQLFAHGIMTSCIVVRGIFFSFDQELWVEELLVAAVTDLIDW